jgi:hypothetical protein
MICAVHQIAGRSHETEGDVARISAIKKSDKI